MTNEELFEKYLKENSSFITVKDAKEYGVNKQTLSVASKQGKIIRVKRGVYKQNDVDEDPYYLACVNNNVIISNESALYLYGLTDRLPDSITVTVLQGSSSFLLKEQRVRKYYVNSNTFEIGKTTIKTPFGNIVPIYDIDRTFVELIKNKNKIDSQIFSQGVRNYMETKNKSIYKALRYAKALRCEKKVKMILAFMLEG